MKFKTHSLLAGFKLVGIGKKIESTLIFPFETPPIRFSSFDGNFQSRLDCIVNLYSTQLPFYLNFFSEFQFYKEKLATYEKLIDNKAFEQLDSKGRRLFLMSLATDYFHEIEGKIPANVFKMDLFAKLLNSNSEEEFKSLISPSDTIEALEAKHKFHIHKSLQSPSYRPELMNFSERLN
ncbi:hypothetical protein [Chryseobacterium sp. R2A-55]|uniref:hypothetical protein n=1 Tax=Chryseobacterium sp. R2A-55 TaxID=2744445 RepID=UPI001F45D719|nr:hypothetical protein [Chryseobacterium sp. R2A-55]